jgi:hypothetical protein
MFLIYSTKSNHILHIHLFLVNQIFKRYSKGYSHNCHSKVGVASPSSAAFQGLGLSCLYLYCTLQLELWYAIAVSSNYRPLLSI